MVHSLTPDNDLKILEDKLKSKRFSYQTSQVTQQKDVWRSIGKNEDGEKSHSISSHSQIFRGVNDINNNKSRAKQFDLGNIWSIRNNVSLNLYNKPNLNNENLSYVNPDMYSRHKASCKGGDPSKENLTHTKTMVNTWNQRRTFSSVNNDAQQNKLKGQTHNNNDEFNHDSASKIQQSSDLGKTSKSRLSKGLN